MSKKALKKLDAFISENKPDDEKLLVFVKELVNANDPSDRTIASRFSNYKKYIRDAHPSYSDEFLRKIAPPKELTAGIIELDRQVRNAKTEIPFDQELVDKILALKDSPNVFDRFIYLQFVSGRRVNEMLDNPIKSVPRSKHTFKMVLSKKKDDSKYFTIELLKGVDAAEFRKMLIAARKAVNGVSISDFTTRLNSRVRKSVRKDLSSHSLRGLYAVYRYETDNPQHQVQTGFISRVLNHGDSSDSGVNYSNYRFQAKVSPDDEA